MKICFSLTNLELGGAQIFVTRLANEIARRNDISVYIYDHWPEFRNKHILKNIDPKVEIACYSEKKIVHWFVWKINALLKRLSLNNTFRYNYNKKSFLKFITKNKINVINSHMSYSDFILSEVNLPIGCKYVITTHGEYELLLTENKKEHREKIKKALLNASAIIYTADKNLIPINEPLTDTKKTKTKINIGFSPDTFKIKTVSRASEGYSDTDFIIGMVARGIPEKGWDTAISVIREYNRTAGKKVKLLLIGDGEYLYDLVTKINDENIRLIQFRKNFQDYFSYYKLFDLFLFPSRFKGESVPNAVIESLFWNIPVIASRHAEIPSMINAGTTEAAGACVSMDTNSKAGDEFITELKKVIDNPFILQSYKRGAKEAFKKFDLKKVADDYLEVFKKP